MEILLITIWLILYAICFYKKSKRGMHILQLEHYKNSEYYKWIKKNKTLSIIEIISIVVATILYLYNNIAGLIILVLIYFISNITRKYPKEKKAFVVTYRIKRMYCTYFIIILIVSLLLFRNYTGMFIILLNILNILSYLFVIAVNIINSPVEKHIQHGFYKKASKKLKDMNNLKIIGITGSYGKTSTKYIVTTILSQKYNALMTPESYNTTMGVVRTINEKLNATHEIFVCEMGAKYVGDIKEICDLVKPDYGILTAIGPQHLETFKNIENIKKTKLELVDSLNEDGIAFINYEDENIQSSNINKKNIKYGFDKKCDVYAENIQITEKGSEFDINIKSEEIIRVKTKLLGKKNILNILGAVAIAKELNLSKEEIQAGIRYLKPVPHRLELIYKNNGNIVIDDAYNSNISGAKNALEVLKSFENRTRVLVTPGIVDLGDKAELYNSKFGEQAAESADYIILVGEKQAQLILKGIQTTKFPKDNVFVVKDLEEGINVLNNVANKNSVILLENDLPDNYI